MGLVDFMIIFKNNLRMSLKTEIYFKTISECPLIQNSVFDAARKKGSGSTKNGRDSVSKRRGIKVYGKQSVNAGGIIVRQVGSTFHPGINVGCGKDYTLFALSSGFVEYESIKGRKCVSVYPHSNEKGVMCSSISEKRLNKRCRRLAKYISRKTI